jgi:hypothetical protein
MAKGIDPSTSPKGSLRGGSELTAVEGLSQSGGC